MRPRIKICCIADTDEANRALQAGADAIGLVGPMPSGPGVIDLDQAATIARQAAPPLSRFLLSSEDSAAGLINAVRHTGVDTLQIVRHLDPGLVGEVASALPSTRIVQVIHVEDDSALDLIPAYEPVCDAFLLDSGRPGAATAELGGTGRAHDWSISARFVAAVDRPVFLAGGLNAGNVVEALQQVQPFGIDLCSSVRTNGRLDSDKLHNFMRAVRSFERTA